MKLDVKNLYGHTVKQIPVPCMLKKEMNPVLFKEVLDYFRSKNRGNYASVKAKSEMSYSKRKLRKQKGSGYARGSNLKQSQHRGGVSLFGPGGEVYSYSIPKKKIKSGLSIALSDKLKHHEMIICDSLSTENHKTKHFLECMKHFGINNCLFVDDTIHETFHLSMRNVPKMEFIKTSALNVLKASQHKHIILTEQALENLTKRLDMESEVTK